MAHEHESSMAVGIQAWHGLANLLAVAPKNSAEAIIAAGCDWIVSERPIFIGSPNDKMIAEAGWKAIVRESDNSVLGIVGSKYKPIQNQLAFEFFDPFIADGSASFETAGSLRKGAVVWVLAKVKGLAGEVGTGDEVAAYLLLYNYHDGTRALGILWTPIRVVCKNTLDAATISNKRGQNGIRIHHHGKCAETLKAVQNMIDMQAKTFSLSLDQYRAMRDTPMDVEGLKKYVKKIIVPQDRSDMADMMKDLLNPVAAKFNAEMKSTSDQQRRDIVTDLLSAHENRDSLAERTEMVQELISTEKMPRAYEKIENAFHVAPGAEMAGSTVWGAYNAVTYWLDHERGQSDQSRMNSSWFGPGKTLRAKAHAEAMALVLAK